MAATQKKLGERGMATLPMALAVAGALLIGLVFFQQRAVQELREERRQAQSARLRMVTKSEIGRVSEFFESGELILDCLNAKAPRLTWDPDFVQPKLKKAFDPATQTFQFMSCSAGALAEGVRSKIYGSSPTPPPATCEQGTSTVKVNAMDCDGHSLDVEGKTTEHDGSSVSLRARLRLTRYDQTPCPYFEKGTPESDPDNPKNMIVFPQYNGWNAHNPLYYYFWGKLFSYSAFGQIPSHSNRVVQPNYTAPNGRPYYRIQQVYFQRPGEPLTFDYYNHQAVFATEVLIGPKDSPKCKVTQQLILDWYGGGCLEAASGILMADGSVRELRTLRPGDEVMNPVTGKATVVAAVVEPKSPPAVVRVEGQGFALDLTENHPVRTVRGVVAAGSLKPGDRSTTHEGREVTVEKVTALASAPAAGLLNLKLATASDDPVEHMIMANGLVVGDLALQRTFGGEASLPEDVREVFANAAPLQPDPPRGIEWLP